MQQKSNVNRQPAEFDLTKGDRVVSKSLGELDSLLLENSLLNQNSPNLAYPESRSAFSPKKLYISPK